MKNAHYFILFAISALMLFSCSKDDNKDEEFTEEYSFTLDGTEYDYDTFDVTTKEDENRLFISKKDGDNLFNINFPLDLNVGANGMDWNGDGLFFFLEYTKGEFYTLDEATSTMNVIEIDTINRTISATFEGVGTQVFSSETAVFTNGVLKAKY